jgi:hypothetical protein
MAILFAPTTELWIGHSLKVSGVLIWGFAAWHVTEAIGTSIAMLLNAASIVRYQVFRGCIFAVSCLTIKVLVLRQYTPEALPWVTAASYILLSLIPVFLLRKRIGHMITVNVY